jgi:hypothetical protein
MAAAAALSEAAALAALERAGAARDMDAVARLLAAHVAQPRVLLRGIALASDTFRGRSRDALSPAARGALLGAALAALRLHVDDARLVAQICCRLVPCAFFEARGVAACARAAQHCGLAQLLVDAMRRHASDVSVQDCACIAITEALEPRAATACALQAGAMEAVVRAVALDARAPRDDAGGYRHYGLRALSMLLKYGELATQRRAIGCGGAAAVVACMRAYPGNHWVQEDACACLSNMLAFESRAQPRAELPARGAADAVDAVVIAMHTHRGVDSQVAACNALPSLWLHAYTLAPRDRTAAAVVAAMTAHARSVEMQMQACIALFNIALGGANGSTYDRGAAFTAACAALRAHAAHPGVVTRACAVVRVMLRDSALTMSYDALMDMLRLLQATQRAHPRLEEVIKLHAAVSDFVHTFDVKLGAPDLTALPPAPPASPASPPASAPRTPVLACARPGCGAASDAVKLLQCCGCRRVWYCCGDCQAQHWREHKAACRAVKNARTWKLN